MLATKQRCSRRRSARSSRCVVISFQGLKTPPNFAYNIPCSFYLLNSFVVCSFDAQRKPRLSLFAFDPLFIESSRFLLSNLIPRAFTTAICTGRELGGNLCQSHLPGWGVLPEKLGGGVRPACQSPHPIYDPSLRYSLPYL